MNVTIKFHCNATVDLTNKMDFYSLFDFFFCLHFEFRCASENKIEFDKFCNIELGSLFFLSIFELRVASFESKIKCLELRKNL